MHQLSVERVNQLATYRLSFQAVMFMLLIDSVFMQFNHNVEVLGKRELEGGEVPFNVPLLTFFMWKCETSLFDLKT